MVRLFLLALAGVLLFLHRARRRARIKREAGTRPGMAWVTITGEAADYYPELRGGALLSVDVARELFSGTPISFDEARDATAESRPASTPLGFEVTLARKTRHEVVTSPNVVGIVRGTDPELADEYVVYSAHLDHNGVGAPVNGDDIYNGAYDNAMGSSLLIETARVFAASPPRRSVLFIAVTAEERGLLGSDYFAHYPTVPTASMVANVNLDMPLFLFPVADIIAFGSEHSSLEATVEAAINAEGFELTPDPMPEENIFRRSDQYSFVRKGVPATSRRTSICAGPVVARSSMMAGKMLRMLVPVWCCRVMLTSRASTRSLAFWPMGSLSRATLIRPPAKSR